MKIMVKIFFIKEYVKSKKFTNTADITERIKSMFADVLNEVLQCELDEQLGYEKHGKLWPNKLISYGQKAEPFVWLRFLFS